MKLQELISRQITEGSDRSLLYHSTLLARAKQIVDSDSLKSSGIDGGNELKKDTFISFSRDSGGQYVKVQNNMMVTFEIDEEKLRRHLIKENRVFDLGPHVFGNNDQGRKNYRREAETRLNLQGREPVSDLKKFVRAVHIFVPKHIKDRAAIPKSEMPPMVGGLPSEIDPDDLSSFGIKSPLEISKENEATINDMVRKLEGKGIRTHLYLDRNDFLRANVHKSFRLKGKFAMNAVRTMLAILSRGKVKLK